MAFAGSPGAGKACLAAEVVGRKDVRAKFGEGVLWLQVRDLPVPFRGWSGGSRMRLVACGHHTLHLLNLACVFTSIPPTPHPL